LTEEAVSLFTATDSITIGSICSIADIVGIFQLEFAEESKEEEKKKNKKTRSNLKDRIDINN
jgi:hypothetical protein